MKLKPYFLPILLMTFSVSTASQADNGTATAQGFTKTGREVDNPGDTPGGPGGPFARGWFDGGSAGMVFSYYGWACLSIPATQSETQQTLSIVLYFGGRAGSGAQSQEFPSATSSRPDAAGACFGASQVGWSGMTFPISGPVYAYAKNNLTGELVELGGSGQCVRWANGSPAC